MRENREETSKKSAEPIGRKSPGLPQRILLIEDDESFAQVFAFALEQKWNCDVIVASDSFEAGNQMSRHPFDLIITDWRLPPFTGFSALRQADHSLALDPEAPEEWFLHKKTPVIVVTVCDAAEVGKEKRVKGRFQFMGVVSKGQPIEGMLEQLRTLYGNFLLPATG
jgi:CheY-like chemotaxis protein